MRAPAATGRAAWDRGRFPPQYRWRCECHRGSDDRIHRVRPRHRGSDYSTYSGKSYLLLLQMAFSFLLLAVDWFVEAPAMTASIVSHLIRKEKAAQRPTLWRPSQSLPTTVLSARLRPKVRWPWQLPAEVCVHYRDRYSRSAPHPKVLKGGQRSTCLTR